MTNDESPSNLRLDRTAVSRIRAISEPPSRWVCRYVAPCAILWSAGLDAPPGRTKARELARRVLERALGPDWRVSDAVGGLAVEWAGRATPSAPGIDIEGH